MDSGVLNLNKPEGMTSRDVVNAVQRLVRPLKCGHAGTLDPLATGVLLVCVGHATRLISFLQEQPKTYLAEFTFGVTSDTDDITGQLTTFAGSQAPPGLDRIQQALSGFVGTIRQVPPAFSAVHVAGRRAYDLARRGESVTLEPREVTVHEIRIVSWQWPHLCLEIKCGSGMYVRSIARDLGQVLGCGGLMSRLQRTCIGTFDVSTACLPSELTQNNIRTLLAPASRIVAGMPSYVCNSQEIAGIACGRPITQVSAVSAGPPENPGENVALVDPDGQLLAIASRLPSQALQPRLVFVRG